MSPAPFPGARTTLRRPPHLEVPAASPGRAGFPWARLLVASAPLIGICAVGFPYYALPMAERVRHPFHAWLRSSGYVGQSAGFAALLLMGFLWLYPVRKKYRRLAFTGPVSSWLEAHVFAALTLPLVAAIHAAWRFGGIIGLGFWAMVVVWLSGVVGRYLYTRIPRGRAGLELTREEIAAERRRLLETIAARDANLGDQCRRALSSAPLNLAEGSYSQGRIRVSRYHTAVGSLREVLACLVVGEALGYLEPIEPGMRDRFDHVIGTLVKIVK